MTINMKDKSDKDIRLDDIHGFSIVGNPFSRMTIMAIKDGKPSIYSDIVAIEVIENAE